MIFIHEFGHFFTAKLCGVRINEFAIGMGPTLFHTQKGDTKYSLRLLPIGGFCAMEGEDEDSDDTYAFNKKPVWQKMLIVVMGAVMNIVFGLVLMIILLGQQSAFNSTTIAAFTKNSAFQAAGMKIGDKFVSVDHYHIRGDKDLSFALATANPSSVDIAVKRDNKTLTFNDVKLHSQTVSGKKYVSLDFYVAPIRKNFGTLIAKSCQDTVSIVRLVWYSLISMLSGKYSLNDMAGPVGAADVIGQAVTVGLKQSFLAGLNNVIYIMTMFTVNLGVFNLIPFPALDGGKFFLFIIEAIRRKPINEKYVGIVDTVGFALLMGFMLIVTYSDILRIATGKGLGG
ncbi:MAG TPA: RIP metalloprotease RseP [Ruminococcaceae bacterium]|jgi:regulator of sigma E protease|nr:RIP metalloprotease RseP [Oscillospiraceae bacterium]